MLGILLPGMGAVWRQVPHWQQQVHGRSCTHTRRLSCARHLQPLAHCRPTRLQACSWRALSLGCWRACCGTPRRASSQNDAAQGPAAGRGCGEGGSCAAAAAAQGALRVCCLHLGCGLAALREAEWKRAAVSANVGAAPPLQVRVTPAGGDHKALGCARVACRT